MAKMLNEYKLSKDRIGLLRYFIKEDGKKTFYHIHSDELTPTQKKIHAKLLKSKK